MPLTPATEPSFFSWGLNPENCRRPLVTPSNVWFSPPTGPSHHETAISILAASGVPGLSKPIHYAVWLHPLPNGHCLVPHLGYHLRRLGGGSHGVQHPSPVPPLLPRRGMGRPLRQKAFDSRGRWRHRRDHPGYPPVGLSWVSAPRPAAPALGPALVGRRDPDACRQRPDPSVGAAR